MTLSASTESSPGRSLSEISRLRHAPRRTTRTNLAPRPRTRCRFRCRTKTRLARPHHPFSPRLMPSAPIHSQPPPSSHLRAPTFPTFPSTSSRQSRLSRAMERPSRPRRRPKALPRRSRWVSRHGCGRRRRRRRGGFGGTRSPGRRGERPRRRQCCALRLPLLDVPYIHEVPPHSFGLATRT